MEDIDPKLYDQIVKDRDTIYQHLYQLTDGRYSSDAEVNEIGSGLFGSVYGTCQCQEATQCTNCEFVAKIQPIISDQSTTPCQSAAPIRDVPIACHTAAKFTDVGPCQYTDKLPETPTTDVNSLQAIRCEIAMQNLFASHGISVPVTDHFLCVVSNELSGPIYYSVIIMPKLDTELKPLLENNPVQLADQICEILKIMFENGLIHGDFHMGNLAFDRRDGFVKVIDFGFASQMADKKPTPNELRVLDASKLLSSFLLRRVVKDKHNNRIYVDAYPNFTKRVKLCLQNLLSGPVPAFHVSQTRDYLTKLNLRVY